MWFYFITAIYGIFLGWSMVKGYDLAPEIPLVFVVLLICIFRLDTIAFLAVLVTPLSLNLSETGLGIGVSLPSEPLMFGLFILFWLKVFAEGGLDRRVLKHPVTIMVLIHLGWFVITTFTSTLFIVSLKSTLARFTYVSVFYFMFLYIFSRYENISKFLWMYIIPLIIIIIYTLYNQFAAGLTEDAAHTAMTPFYNDHTAYGAAISFFIPVLFAMITDSKKTLKNRLLLLVVLLILLTAIVMSYTRASWVGLIGAFGCFLILLFRLKGFFVYSGLVIVVLLSFAYSTDITMYLGHNTKVSSTDYASHVQSIGNISTDDSNIERLNRWASALRMFESKPLLGFGPGTYMFRYAPYQKDSEKSRISTNNGTGGGSHSEYLGPLSEQGILGPILFILIGAVAIQHASRFIKTCEDKSVRILAKGLLLGLITYWFQGTLNYFLDTEKISVPFWGFLSALVALEIYHSKHQVKDLSK